jgi:diguanylate cyclase (GGDEF)-like protein
MSNFALTTVLSMLVFRAIVDAAQPVGVSGWVAALAAASLGHFLQGAMVILAISFAEGRPPRLSQLLSMGTAFTTVNICLGLTAVTIVAADPWAAWLLVMPAMLVYKTSDAFSRLQQKHENLELLYDATSMVAQSVKTEAVIATLLHQTRELMRAEDAEILVFSGTPDVRGTTGTVRARLSADASPVFEHGVPLDPTEGIWARAVAEGHVLLPSPLGAGRLSEQFAARGVRDVISVTIAGEHGTTGTITALNRLGAINTFTTEDLKSFETFANHVSVSLENARLFELQRARSEENAYLATHDALTGLPNRTRFRADVDAALAAAVAPGGCAVLLMDLDHFKEVNDTLGHQNGDLLLQEVARRLSASVRPGEHVARLSGDEFAVLVPGVADEAPAGRAAERILGAFAEPFVINGMPLARSTSMGIALSPRDATDPDTLLQRADVALYDAKRSRRGHEFYRPERDQYSPARLALYGEFKRALEEDELLVEYQPQADLRTGRITSAEALVRWRHPIRGLISPVEFIPIVEQTDLVRPLARFVLGEAVRQGAAWRRAGLAIAVAVNLSTRNLLEPDLPDHVEALLTRYDLPARALELEVTETDIMADEKRADACLDRLRALGVRIAVDDFGTGESSYSRLRHLPIDVLKIDKSFIVALQSGGREVSIVKSMIDLGRNLGLRVVAEGAETDAAFQVLQELGCDYVQGYFVAWPMPADDLTQHLLQSTRTDSFIGRTAAGRRSDRGHLVMLADTNATSRTDGRLAITG